MFVCFDLSGMLLSAVMGVCADAGVYSCGSLGFNEAPGMGINTASVHLGAARGGKRVCSSRGLNGEILAW